MSKYKRKSAVIEAFQYNGDLKGSDESYYVPEWAKEAFEERIFFYNTFNEEPGELFIQSYNGSLTHVDVNDYIIKRNDGEFYVFKPDVFEQLYEISDTKSLFTLTEEEVGELTPVFSRLLSVKLYDLVRQQNLNPGDKVIYVPTETGLPILEAGKGR